MIATSNSASGFGGKLGSGLGTSVIGWLLAAAGYDSTLATATEAIKTAIYGFAIVIPLILFLVLFVLISKFDLEKLLPRMKEEIMERNKKDENI